MQETSAQSKTTHEDRNEKRILGGYSQDPPGCPFRSLRKERYCSRESSQTAIWSCWGRIDAKVKRKESTVLADSMVHWSWNGMGL